MKAECEQENYIDENNGSVMERSIESGGKQNEQKYKKS